MIQKLLNQIEMLENIIANKNLSLNCQERIVYRIMVLEDRLTIVSQMTLEAEL